MINAKFFPFFSFFFFVIEIGTHLEQKTEYSVKLIFYEDRDFFI